MCQIYFTVTIRSLKAKQTKVVFKDKCKQFIGKTSLIIYSKRQIYYLLHMNLYH